jgi:hypothetical protein
MTTRREILIGAASIALIPACGNTNGMGDAGPTGPTCMSSIASNHGHVLTVPGAHLTAPADHTYDIHGSADHTHDVMLTAADLTMLAAGTTVSVTSSLGAGHTHNCMIHCG